MIILMPSACSGADQIIECGPIVGGVTEMFLDTHEISCAVPVVGGGGVAVAVRDVQIEIIHRRRNPDGGDSQALK